MPKLSWNSTDHELASFAAVSSLLWSERELLEQVLYRLTVQGLLLASGETRWLNKVNTEVTAALRQVSGTDVLRAAEIEALADTLNLPHETTLAELAAVAPEPWGTLYTEHRAALRELISQIHALGADISRLLQSGLSAIRETLDSLSTTVGGYDASGTSVGAGDRPMLLDEQA